MAQEFINPDWSHELAIVAQSSIWHGQRGQQAKDAFMDEAERYGSYDALPPRLKATYDKATRQRPGKHRAHRKEKGRQ